MMGKMPIGTIFAWSLPLPGLILLVSEYRHRRRRVAYPRALSMQERSISLRNVGLAGAMGAVWGCISAAWVGALLGTCVGWYNETSANDQELHDLHLGFGEYSMQGMGFWCGVISGFLGLIAGSVSGVSKAITGRVWIGPLAFAIVAAWICIVSESSSFSLYDRHGQPPLIWLVSAAIGSIVGSTVKMRG